MRQTRPTINLTHQSRPSFYQLLIELQVTIIRMLSCCPYCRRAEPI